MQRPGHHPGDRGRSTHRRTDALASYKGRMGGGLEMDAFADGPRVVTVITSDHGEALGERPIAAARRGMVRHGRTPGRRWLSGADRRILDPQPAPCQASRAAPGSIHLLADVGAGPLRVAAGAVGRRRSNSGASRVNADVDGTLAAGAAARWRSRKRCRACGTRQKAADEQGRHPQDVRWMSRERRAWSTMKGVRSTAFAGRRPPGKRKPRQRKWLSGLHLDQRPR